MDLVADGNNIKYVLIPLQYKNYCLKVNVEITSRPRIDKTKNVNFSKVLNTLKLIFFNIMNIVLSKMQAKL